MDLKLRSATVKDAESLARVVIDGFEVYRDFAPPTWEPSSLDDELALLRELLTEESTWYRLAEVDGQSPGPDVVIVEYRYRLWPEPMAG